MFVEEVLEILDLWFPVRVFSMPGLRFLDTEKPRVCWDGKLMLPSATNKCRSIFRCPENPSEKRLSQTARADS